MTVGIVGMGIAGLRAAMLLEEQGADVELFEAKGRPGGRLHTVDEGHGVLYEAGGEWIDADHHRCIGLLRDFGLAPALKNREWPGKLHFKGEIVNQDQMWDDAMEDDLRVESAAKELCSRLCEPPWSNTHHPELDARTLDDFLREHTSSERGLWYVTNYYRSDEGDEPERVGLLGWLAGYMNYMDREDDLMSAYRVPGGFRSLCEMMLAKLTAERHFGHILRRVDHTPIGISLSFEGKPPRVFDQVVLALPPPALEHVVFDHPLSAKKRCALEATGMSRTIKIVWQFKDAWWKELNWGGSLHSDSPVQQTWDGSLGEAPVLTAYICGDQAEAWLHSGDPVKMGLYELTKIFPQASKLFERGWFHDWLTDPFARGGFMHLPPGFVLNHMEHLRTPERGLHFAGEHTGLYSGFIEGALESAERVAEEIKAL